MSKHFAELTGQVTVQEAKEGLSRFNASHWGNRASEGEKARYSIPANPKRDDDIRLNAFVEHTEQLIAVAHTAAECLADFDGTNDLFHELIGALANFGGSK